MNRALSSLALGLLACDPNGLGRSNPDFLVIAHHGLPNFAAENTIPSYRAAVSVGANAIEADVNLTRDGQLVMWHDRDPDDTVSLSRQVGAEGFLYTPAVPPVGSEYRRPIEQLTLAELRQYYGYALSGRSRDSSIYIPTLEEMLDWARTEPQLKAIYLDLKLRENDVESLVPLVARIASDPNLSRIRFYFLSVHPAAVIRLEQARRELGADNPRIVHDYETPGALEGTLSKGLRDVSIGITPSFTYSGYKDELAAIVEARERGEIDTVMAWTFDREFQIAELLYYSVDGVITNEVPLLHRMWRETVE